MKRNHKIYLRITIFLMLLYIGLLLVLYLSEHTDSTATIRTLGDACWYSLVTLTTVGYGDLTPVTPLGHAVGSVFLLLSAGIMMTLFGAVISFVTSEGLPFFLLGLQRRKNWYYFADCGIEASTLAENICREDPDAMIIFGEKKKEQMEFPDYPCLFISASPARIVARIAPSTPPPPSRLEFAALTIACASVIFVMSPFAVFNIVFLLPIFR